MGRIEGGEERDTVESIGSKGYIRGGISGRSEKMNV